MQKALTIALSLTAALALGGCTPSPLTATKPTVASAEPANPKPGDGDQSGAVAACRDFVDDRLGSTYRHDLPHRETRTGRTWTIQSGITENEHHNYTCKVEFTGDDRGPFNAYRLISLTTKPS